MILDEYMVLDVLIGKQEENLRFHRLLLSDLEVIAISLGKCVLEIHSSEIEWIEALGYHQNGAHLIEAKEAGHAPVIVFHLIKTLTPTPDLDPLTVTEVEPQLESSLVPALFAALHKEYGGLPPSN